ncbi:MAG TPA: PQQ-binding-like beta-propeller repeat protein [Acetobacteraceae bacterium]|nr:PQQ-binding-like beta-propeller repeat protein [Acetobacteraceae bacterium]
MGGTGSGRLTRRSALLAPFALSGCGLWDDWFGTKKTPLPGKREPVLGGRRTLQPDEGVPKVELPPAVANAAWPQAGGNPTHFMGHLAAGERLGEAWSASIGAGGGYRRKILAQPVAADGIVYVMDSDAVVSAFDMAQGGRLWRFETRLDEDDSTNVGGGLALDQGTLYTVNGLAELVALDAAKGTVRWRSKFGAPTRSAPTVVEGRLFVTTIEDRLLALATDDGRQLWTHQATNPTTSILGRPAPAYADGLVIAGFGSGELSAMRADSGSVAWADTLAAAATGGGLVDFSAIRGLPVVADGRVYAMGVGGLTVAIDLPSGRRLWEREAAGEDSPWAAGSWLFVISLDQRMAAINREDGRIAWVTELPRWENPEKQKDPITWYGPLLAGDRLIAGGTNHQAVAVSPYTGEIIGQQELSGAASLGPIVAGGTVFLVTDDGRLLALR